MTAGKLIAIDWGTTNRRIYLIDGDGAVLKTVRDERGALAMVGGDYGAEIDEIGTRFGAHPIICAGMAGSSLGWCEVPYVEAPASIADLGRACLEVQPRVWIVPGVCDVFNRPDVMRGEEVQLLGAIEAGLAPPDALLCQPGTHCKWAKVENGRIVSFDTAMTGEIFALLKCHSLLSRQLIGNVEEGPAFSAGLEEGRTGELLTSLFRVRAAGLLGHLSDEDAPSFASGVLIGADVGAALSRHDCPQVHVLADAALAQLYCFALARHGRDGIAVDSNVAFVAGIRAIWSAIS